MKLSYLTLVLSSAILLAACQQQEATPPAGQAASETAAPPAAASVPAASAVPASSASEAAAKPSARKNGKFFGTDVKKDDIGGDFTLTDGSGKPFALSSLKGKVVLLTFGYTNCPDVCPTSLLTYNDVVSQLDGAAKDVAVVFVSVDPERDTPEAVGKYAKTFNPDFIGLTATGSQSIPVVKQQYRVVSAKSQQQSDGIYLVDHTAGTYVLDKSGETVLFEKYGNTAAEIAEDVKTLLAES
ncbi:MAG: SCO family protein [Neisseria sp.]|nr:SCO family protein [Neisseria sp.]